MTKIHPWDIAIAIDIAMSCVIWEDQEQILGHVQQKGLPLWVSTSQIMPYGQCSQAGQTFMDQGIRTWRKLEHSGSLDSPRGTTGQAAVTIVLGVFDPPPPLGTDWFFKSD